MQNARIILVAFFLFTGFLSHAQDPTVIQSYISTYKEIAIAEMQRTGVPASIKLAQGIHETTAGTSVLVVKSNNHFGIKCKATWTGESVSHDDDLRGECFRKYSSSALSYRDHSDFLRGNSRYAQLFKLDPLDYAGWANGLKKAGYATNPRYPQVIIKLIEEYHLQDYTLIALGKGPLQEDALAKTTEEKKIPEFLPEVAVAKKEEPVKSAMPAQKMVVKVKQYPAGEFKINETKVIYAAEGTPFLTIAQQYHVPLVRIFEFNDLKECETVAKDQLIYLQRKRKTGDNQFHTVKAGETLYDIAQEEAIRMESLLEYNQLQNSMKPAVGQQLYLQSKAPSRPGLAMDETTMQDQLALVKSQDMTRPAITDQSASKEEGSIVYTVQPKETIWAISKKYNVKIDDLAAWNQLSNYDLKTGQQLKIYK